MKQITPYSFHALLCCILITALVSCKSHNDDQDDVRQPYVIPDSLMKTLVIDTVKTSNITDAIKFNGMVDFNADKVISIFPLVSGNVSGITVMPGDYVKAGQTLGVVRSAEVANYNSSLINAEANVRLTAKQLTQQQELYKSGLASQVDITSAQANYEQAVAAKIAAQKILSINGNNKNGEFLIKAPIEGFIVLKNVNNGQSIRTDNNAALFTISDLKDVWIQANVYEENISKLHQGDEADVTTIAYPDKVFKGKVDKLMNVLDPTTKVMKMRVVLSNPGYLLKPQMFTTVTMYNQENQQATAISSKDLVFDHSQYFVVVYKDRQHTTIRNVDLMSINGKTAYIKSGVTPGEKVIGSNAILIYGSLNN